MPRRRQYTDETLAEAVEAISSGKRQVDVAKETRIPSSTLAKYVRKKRNNEGSSHARRGPEPAVTTEDEADLVSWTVGMQLNGTPACRADIIARGSQMVPLIGDAEARLSDVWYFRFAARHPELTMRQAQTVSRARNECSFEKLELFFETVKSLISVNDLNAMRIYNMNETSFISCNRSATVVALRGSKSVWRKDITANFHLSVVACGSASGRVVPPLFIFPGMRVERDLMSGCGIEGARVTCSASGFIKKVIFVKWVEMFAKSVPSAVKCPLLLIFDGYLSHLSIDLIDKGEELGIMFVCLLANATHLIQPIDIAVFPRTRKPFVSWFASFSTVQVCKQNALILVIMMKIVLTFVLQAHTRLTSALL